MPMDSVKSIGRIKGISTTMNRYVSYLSRGINLFINNPADFIHNLSQDHMLAIIASGLILMTMTLIVKTAIDEGAIEVPWRKGV